MSLAFILIHDNNMNRFFTRLEYAPAFKKYEEICQPFFDELPADSDGLEALAAEGLKELDACWRSKPFFSRNSARSNDRIMFCTFFSPAAREHSETAFQFAEKLREKWIAAYPGEPFDSADYEAIQKGFEPETFLGFKINK